MRRSRIAMTGERIRDKFAASKKKGIWMGGQIPLGYTKRGTTRYHYYLNKVTKARMSVGELHGIVEHALNAIDTGTVELSLPHLSAREIAIRFPNALVAIMERAVDRIVLHERSISVMLNKATLSECLSEQPASITRTLETGSATVIDHPDHIEVAVEMAFRSYAGRMLAFSGNRDIATIRKSNHDPSLVTAIVRSYKWNKLLDKGTYQSAVDIARAENIERTYATDILRLKYLCPEIVTMIMNGTQPRTLSVSKLVRQPLPANWHAQKQLLGIA